MMRALIFVLLIGFASVSANTEEIKTPPTASDVVHVATALDHLTVLEFGEPVTLAATGSQAFQIERHEDKVFIKPLKAGASTDLFVWTNTRRFAYELESPGEVTQMNFALDSRPPAPKPAPDAGQKLDEIADMVLTRAFLGAERIDSSLIKDNKDGVTVRVQSILQSRNTLYIHYAISSRSRQSYRVPAPRIEQLFPAQPGISVAALRGVQLSRRLASKLGEARPAEIAIAHAEVQKPEIDRGEETQGIIAIRQKIEGPTVLRLSFSGDGRSTVEALLVL
jgi:hypothetical protein